MRIIISGGLGNQMFQYAMYHSLKAKGKNVKLDTTLYSFAKMHNGYELERCFGIKAPQVKVTKWGILKLRILLKYMPKTIVYNDKLQYDDQVYKTMCKYLNGPWQSEKYFEQIKTEIKEVFCFKNIDANNQKIANEMRSNTSISLHIRQGDYVGVNGYEGICTEDYYLKAINRLKDEIGNDNNNTFYVFSDDINFAKKFLSKLNLNAKFLNSNKGLDSYKDMYLMSHCKHNIIANSSFSWWGAWLNDNSEKVVVAPKRWINNSNANIYKDILPQIWIKI